MAFLAPADQALLTERFDTELSQPVRLLLFTEPRSGLYLPGTRACESCADTEALLTELVELSDNLTLEVHNVKEEPEIAAKWQISQVPTIAILRSEDLGIRFMGLPSGYEFMSLIETIVATGGGGTPLSEETIARLGTLDADIDIKTFSTPT
ncbi:MAG: thioredoxin family protein [Actinomycetota bacterium]